MNKDIPTINVSKNKIDFIPIIFAFIFAIMVMLMFSQFHEVTHYQIGKYYGCNGEIHWDFLDFNKSYTETMDGELTAFMSTHWNEDCIQSESQILAHSINEIIGYNVMPILEMILILLFMNSMFNSGNIVGKKEKRKLNIVDKK